MTSQGDSFFIFTKITFFSKQISELCFEVWANFIYTEINITFLVRREIGKTWFVFFSRCRFSLFCLEFKRDAKKTNLTNILILFKYLVINRLLLLLINLVGIKTNNFDSRYDIGGNNWIDIDDLFWNLMNLRLKPDDWTWIDLIY